MLNLSFSGKSILTLDHKNTVSSPYGSLFVPHVFPAVRKLCVWEQRYHILLDWKINVVLLSDINWQERVQKEILRYSLDIRASIVNIPQLFGDPDIRLNVPVTLGLISQSNLQHHHRFTSFFFSFYSLSSLIRVWVKRPLFLPATFSHHPDYGFMHFLYCNVTFYIQYNLLTVMHICCKREEIFSNVSVQLLVSSVMNYSGLIAEFVSVVLWTK